MIKYGMAPYLNGIWEKRQLSPELQNIIVDYLGNLNGTPVGDNRHLKYEKSTFRNEGQLKRRLLLVRHHSH